MSPSYSLDVPSKRAVNWTFPPSTYTFILLFFPFFFFLIGTSQGAALINLESGGLSWVCRSKSDIFSQQFDHSVILDITPTFLEMHLSCNASLIAPYLFMHFFSVFCFIKQMCLGIIYLFWTLSICTLTLGLEMVLTSY